MNRPSAALPFSRATVVCALLAPLALLAAGPLPACAQEAPRFDPELYGALEYRLIGPHRGGRVTAVAGVGRDPRTFYMGSTGGGVWKTTTAGESWENVSDGFFEAGSMGAIAVAPSDPEVVYAGTGSACPRGNVSPGIGVYRSTDGGETWSFSGLPEAGQIGAVEVDPRNPDRVWVAALGHIFGPNPERGVYRSEDGGRSWEPVLQVSDSTGAVDLALDPTNPRVLYAAMWRAERKPWTIVSGAREGGLFKTTDGGDTWTKLENGLPTGLVGRIGVAVSPADPDRVWALVEAEEGEGLYRSDDAGRSFRPVNLHQKMLMARPWYYTHVHADPRDPNTVYVNNERFWKSVDGGETFLRIDTPHGDNHDLWIHPHDPRVMVQANDGGANVSVDGGRTWTTQRNQPTAELYSVTVDNQFPYRVYAPQQDNSTLSLPSRVLGGLDPYPDWYSVGGCETGPIALDPDDPRIVYAGCYGGRLTRFDRSTGQTRQVADWPHIHHGRGTEELRYRFQWNAPVLVSRHDPGTVYHASQFVHRSRTGGEGWEVISPDLTRADSATMDPAGEPITWDITGVEAYPTVFALAESAHDPGVLWAGTNDGRIHVSRDGGGSWTDVTPGLLPAPTTVNRIETSPHAPGRAWVAAYRYRLDDFRPYLLRTDDWGESWELLTDGTNGIPTDHPTRVVREDPEREGLLYAGTEFGLFVSFDGGGSWQTLQQNLPRTPVTDLTVHRGDLVVATQGRSLWILDDLSPLRQLSDEITAADAHLFRPRDAWRVRQGGRGVGGDRGPENPPDGAVFHYLLRGAAGDGATLEVVDAEGRTTRTFSADAEDEADRLPTGPALQRVVWDLRYPGAELVSDGHPNPDRDIIWGDTGGPDAVPGTYRVRLTAGGRTQVREFEVRIDPRLEATRAALREQFDYVAAVRDRLTEVHDGLRRLRSVREQARELVERVEGRPAAAELGPLADSIAARLGRVEERLLELRDGDVAKLRPRLSSQLAWLIGTARSADAAPTPQLRERFRELSERAEAELGTIREVLESDVAGFRRRAEELGVGPLVIPSEGPG